MLYTGKLEEAIHVPEWIIAKDERPSVEWSDNRWPVSRGSG